MQIFFAMSFVLQPIAWVTGIPEPTLRLLTTICLAYPVARVYNRMYMCDSSSSSSGSEGRGGGVVSAAMVNERNMFILISGLGLSLFFNGSSILHSLATVTLSYVMLYASDRYLHNRRIGTIGVWILNGLYLLCGYLAKNSSDEYDISWTMPQCILCLRLMGFSFDFLDGATIQQQGLNNTSQEEKKTARPLSFSHDTPLKDLPDFAEVLAYCYFPSAFLVGPQFSFSLYKRWLTRPGQKPGTTTAAAVEQEEAEKAQMRYVARCVGLAILYLALQQGIGARYYPTSYLLTDAYKSLPILKRIWILLVSGKFVYNKYVGVWLLTEGATAYFGLSYDDDADADDEHHRFGGLANVAPARLETATSIDHVIGAFNINTNLWVKCYVFKRLRFLGNKQLSQLGALAFLALWHGFHVNYFLTFLTEFLATECERILRKRWVPLVEPWIKNDMRYRYTWKVAAWLACSVTCDYAVIQFDLLKFDKAWTAYKNVWFFGHLALLAVLVADRVLLGPQTIIPKVKKN